MFMLRLSSTKHRLSKLAKFHNYKASFEWYTNRANMSRNCIWNQITATWTFRVRNEKSNETFSSQMWFQALYWHKPKVILTLLCNAHSCELQQCVVTARFLYVKCLSMNFSLFVLQIKISARCGRIRSRSEVGMRSLHIKFYLVNKRDSSRFQYLQRGDAVIPKASVWDR